MDETLRNRGLKAMSRANVKDNSRLIFPNYTKKEQPMTVMAVVVLLLLFFPNAALSQNEQKMPFYVDVNVTANANLETNITNNLLEALGFVEDVEIKSDNPHFTISITALEIKTKDGSEGGVAMSIIFTNYLNAHIVYLTLKKYLPQEYNQFLKNIYMMNLCTVEQQFLQVCTSNHLNDFCTNLIIKFDIEVLQKYRRMIADLPMS